MTAKREKTRWPGIYRRGGKYTFSIRVPDAHGEHFLPKPGRLGAQSLDCPPGPRDAPPGTPRRDAVGQGVTECSRAREPAPGASSRHADMDSGPAPSIPRSHPRGPVVSRLPPASDNRDAAWRVLGLALARLG